MRASLIRFGIVKTVSIDPYSIMFDILIIAYINKLHEQVSERRLISAHLKLVSSYPNLTCCWLSRMIRLLFLCFLVNSAVELIAHIVLLSDFPLK